MTLAIAISSVISLSALLVGLFALIQIRVLLRASGRHFEAFHTERDAALDALRSSLTDLAAQIHDLQSQPPAGPPGLPRAAFNLSKRSQALRMHRKGDTPAQIAAALDIPPQEVDLLVKVHRIVVSNL